MNLIMTGGNNELIKYFRKEHTVITLREEPDDDALEDWIITRWDSVSVVLDVVQLLAQRNVKIDAIVIAHSIPVESGEFITNFDVMNALDYNVLKPIFLMRLMFQFDLFSDHPKIGWKVTWRKVEKNHALYVAEHSKINIFKSYFIDYLDSVTVSYLETDQQIIEFINEVNDNSRLKK